MRLQQQSSPYIFWIVLSRGVPLFVTFEEGTWAAWLYDLMNPHLANSMQSAQGRAVQTRKQE